MDKIFDRKLCSFFWRAPSPPHLNVDLECSLFWTKYSIRKNCQPSYAFNIEIGGGREGIQFSQLCLSNILSIYRLA